MADRRPVVLVHGLWYRAWSVGMLRKQLAAAGLAVHGFSYPTLRQSPEANAAALAQFVRRHGGSVDFVAHSLGGLVVQHMLRSAQLPVGGRVVLLGTPLKGSAVARRLADWRLAGILLGQAAGLLREGSVDLAQGWEIGMIAGDRPVGLGRLTGVLDPPHDGTVAVAETRHPGLSAHRVFPVTHTGMLVSGAVAAAAARFLHTGGFDGEG